MSKYFLTLFLHSNVIGGEAGCKNATVHVAVGISKQKDLFTGGYPQSYLCTNVVHENGPWAAVVTD